MKTTAAARTATLTESTQTWNQGGTHIECNAGCESYALGFKNSPNGFEYGARSMGATREFWANLGYQVTDLRANPTDR
jgi:primase-polymerase (primpol)-like protein